jgi:hypothetical protein
MKIRDRSIFRQKNTAEVRLDIPRARLPLLEIPPVRAAYNSIVHHVKMTSKSSESTTYKSSLSKTHKIATPSILTNPSRTSNTDQALKVMYIDAQFRTKSHLSIFRELVRYRHATPTITAPTSASTFVKFYSSKLLVEAP